MQYYNSTVCNQLTANKLLWKILNMRGMFCKAGK